MDIKSKSKFLSLILRHKPETIGMNLDKHGWLNIESLIKNAELIANVNINIEDLFYIVHTDEKHRYEISEDGLNIRACQGHSIEVNLNLKPLEPPTYLYHGTAPKSIVSIIEKGIQKQSRQYLHLSIDIETAIAVGKRYGKPLVIVIETERMFVDGYKFYLSTNKVWLTDNVPVKYIEMILVNP